MAAIPKDFGYTSEHDLLRKTARKLLDDKCPLTRVRELVDDEQGFDQALMGEVAELGWLGILVPEDHGGVGLDHLSMALIMEECGRVLLPGPFFASVLAAVAIDEMGSEDQKKRLLPAIAAGELNVTVALSPAQDGVLPHVLWAQQADHVIAPVGDRYAIVPTSMCWITDEVSIDSTRRMQRLGLGDDHGTPLAGDDGAWARFQCRARALLAAEMVGAAQRILTITRDYAIERTQFGRQIGSFQAVKHPLVNVMIAIEKARSLAYAAAAAIDHAPARADLQSRAAKVAAEHALHFAADRGVQFHGGYGFTWDCDAHFFVKRALWSAATLGDAHHHRRHIAEAICADSAEA